MQKSNIIIFGAANGLGRAVTEKLADEKNHLIIVDRDLKSLEIVDDFAKSKGVTTTIVHLDITESVKIYELASIIFRKFGSINILISFAAILGELAPINHYDNKLWHKVIETNLNANFTIIKAFHPLLQLAKSSQAIFSTCSIAKENKAYWGAYSVSKSALDNLVKIYAAENSHNNIKISLFDPGPIPTKIRYQAMPGEDKSNMIDIKKVANYFVQSLTNDSFKHGNILEFV